MKLFKKIVAVLLTLTVLAGVLALPASAASSSDDEIVVRMYVGHKARNWYLSGHTWVYFENLSNKDIKVGLYTVKPGKGVSVGTYGYEINDGRGVYYNVEAYRYNNPRVTNYIYLSKDLTESQLEKVSDKILRSGTWGYLLNCSYFAFSTWNVILGKPLIYMIFPLLAMLQILIYPDHGEGFEMYSPKLDEIYKQIGRGDDAYLVNVDPRTN